MAKHGRKRGAKRGRSASRGNTCCPMIRVKCGRTKRAGKLGDAGIPGFLRTAEQILAEKKATQKLSRIKGHRVICTVRVGSTVRRVNAVSVPMVLRKLVRNQVAKRCVPSVNGRLVMGRRAGKL